MRFWSLIWSRFWSLSWVEMFNLWTSYWYWICETKNAFIIHFYYFFMKTKWDRIFARHMYTMCYRHEYWNATAAGLLSKIHILLYFSIKTSCGYFFDIVCVSWSTAQGFMDSLSISLSFWMSIKNLKPSHSTTLLLLTDYPRS